MIQKKKVKKIRNMDTITQIQKWKQFVQNQESRSFSKRLRQEKTNSMRAFDYFDLSRMEKMRPSHNNVDLGAQDKGLQVDSQKHSTLERRQTNPAL